MQLGGAGKGMSEGDFGLVPGTTAVRWELALGPGAGCGGTLAAAHPGGGICGSGGAPWPATRLCQDLAAAVPCWGRQPLQRTIQNRSAGQPLAHIKPLRGQADGSMGGGACRDPGWYSSGSGKAH